MMAFKNLLTPEQRKQEKVNRHDPAHDDSNSPKPWRENPFPDVPFNEIGIELLPIGDDGHVIIQKKDHGG